MSGGLFNYTNDRLSEEIFGWEFYPHYGKEGFSKSKRARKANPLEDKQLSEMLFDFLCLLHSFDYYKKGDTSEKVWKEDVKYFKEKWFGKTAEELVVREIELSMEEAKTELLETFGIIGGAKMAYREYLEEVMD